MMMTDAAAAAAAVYRRPQTMNVIVHCNNYSTPHNNNTRYNNASWRKATLHGVGSIFHGGKFSVAVYYVSGQ